MKYLEAKALCDNVLKDEISKHNLDIESYSFGRLSYYNSTYFKENIKKMNKLSLSLVYRFFAGPLINTGYFAYTDDTLVVFLNNIIGIDFSCSAVDILRTSYHEIYHAIDHRNIRKGYYDLNYNIFASSIDRFLRDHYIGHFLKYKFTRKGHDTCMFEILADVYAVKEAEEFIKRNPHSYKYEYFKLERYKHRCYKNYMNYDLSKRLDFIIKNYIHIKKCSDFDDSVFSIFLNADGTIKSLNVIRDDKRINDIDKKIISAFLNTKAFNNQFSLELESTLKNNR